MASDPHQPEGVDAALGCEADGRVPQVVEPEAHKVKPFTGTLPQGLQVGEGATIVAMEAEISGGGAVQRAEGNLTKEPLLAIMKAERADHSQEA
jgi:hypothetical protein